MSMKRQKCKTDKIFQFIETVLTLQKLSQLVTALQLVGQFQEKTTLKVKVEHLPFCINQFDI